MIPIRIKPTLSILSLTWRRFSDCESQGGTIEASSPTVDINGGADIFRVGPSGVFSTLPADVPALPAPIHKLAQSKV